LREREGEARYFGEGSINLVVYWSQPTKATQLMAEHFLLIQEVLMHLAARLDELGDPHCVRLLDVDVPCEKRNAGSQKTASERGAQVTTPRGARALEGVGAQFAFTAEMNSLKDEWVVRAGPGPSDPIDPDKDGPVACPSQ